jgi:hypothetical protein
MEPKSIEEVRVIVNGFRCHDESQISIVVKLLQHLDSEKRNQALSMSGVVVSPCDHSDTYPLNQKYSKCRKCGGCVED